MILIPSIINLEPCHYLGIRIVTSHLEDQTFKLWSSFMPHVKFIENRIGRETYSLIYYPSNYFNSFKPQLTFEKWAAVKVDSRNQVIDGLELLSFSGGKYAKFQHKGSMELFLQTMTEIYLEWLPNSGFTMDYRPHFTVMAENYRPDMEFFEEEIWIPIV